MRHYEAVVFFSPQLVGEKLEEVKKSFEEQVRKQGGKVIAQHEMGKRAFGYRVKRQSEGLYFVVDFDLEPALVNDLKKTLSLTEAILRYTIFIKEEFPQKPVVPHPTFHSKPTHPTTSGTQTRS